MMEEEKNEVQEEIEPNEEPIKKYDVPWGILIFCGVIALVMVALIIIITKL